MTKIKSVYYAHPMSWYGTEAEGRDIASLSKAFPSARIVNPNWLHKQFSGDEWEIMSSAEKMAFFLVELGNLDVLAFRPFTQGGVGAGVAKEILEAYVLDKAVYIIKGGYPTKGDRLARDITVSRQLFFPAQVFSIAKTRRLIKRKIM